MTICRHYFVKALVDEIGGTYREVLKTPDDGVSTTYDTFGSAMRENLGTTKCVRNL